MEQPYWDQTQATGHLAIAPQLIFIPGHSGWVERFSAHSYLLLGRDKTVLIDPGSSRHLERLGRTLNVLKIGGMTVSGQSENSASVSEKGDLSRQVNQVVVTHEHWDHVVASDAFPGAEKCCSKHALAALERRDPAVIRHHFRDEVFRGPFTHGLKDGEVIDLGDLKLTVLLTPGHTPGSLCLYEPTKKWLFTGDTFFAHGAISRIFEEIGGSRADHVQTLERLCELDIEWIGPGHGEMVQGKSACQDSLRLSLKRARTDLG